MAGQGTQPSNNRAPKAGWYVLKTDGGITREQGQAAGRGAIGVVLKDHRYRDVCEVSKRIGRVRNHHVPEFKALIAGLELARRHGIDRIRVFSDSALVVNSVNRDSNLEPEHLKALCTRAILLHKEFRDIKLAWGPLRNESRSRHACKQSARPRSLGTPSTSRRWPSAYCRQQDDGRFRTRGLCVASTFVADRRGGRRQSPVRPEWDRVLAIRPRWWEIVLLIPSTGIALLREVRPG